MAKAKMKDKKAVKLDRNRFGTKSDMVVKEIKEGEKVVQVLAQDAKGHYLTQPEYVDSGLADPNRYSGSRHVPKELFEEEKEETKEEKKEDVAKEAGKEEPKAKKTEKADKK